MSPHGLKVPAHRMNLRCVGAGAICAIFNYSNITGLEVNSHQTEGKAVKCIDQISPGKIINDSNMPNRLPACKDSTRLSVMNPLIATFNLHIKTLLESTLPSSLKKELRHYLEQDWINIEKLLGDGDIDRIQDIKSHWRQIELLMGDTNDIFLQEGAVLSNFVMGETDLASEFYASVEGMEMCILEGMRNESLPSAVKSLLLKFKDRLLQCRNEVQAVLKSGMQEDKRTKALKAQREKLFAQFKAFVDQTPQSRYRDLFKRRGYRCLMSLQDCQRSLPDTPEIAAFSKSLRAIAANTGDFKLFGKLFHIIYTTLRDADTSPRPQIASVLATQCNEILSQHGHLFSPAVVEVLEAQKEAALKRISDSAFKSSAPDKSVSELEGWLAQEGWLARLVNIVSSFVSKRCSANANKTVHQRRDFQARQRPITAFDLIADVNPALAGTIRGFLVSVRAKLAGVPLRESHSQAIQRLFRSEFHIVDELKKTCMGVASRGEIEMKIKEIFENRVNSLWPSIISGLDSEICAALDRKYAEAFATLNQTSTLGSLIRSVRKLTPDIMVLTLSCYVILSSFLSGAEGGLIPDKQSNYDLVRLSPDDWKDLVCPILDRGFTQFNTWFRINHLTGQKVLFACLNETSHMADQVVQVWRDFRGESPCESDRLWRTSESLQLNETHHAPNEIKDPTGPFTYDFSCPEVMRKELRDFGPDLGYYYCQLGGSGKGRWNLQASHHPDGPFIFCADPKETIFNIHRYFVGHDDAQYRQLHCRPAVGADLSGGIPPELRVSDAIMTYQPPSAYERSGSLVLSNNNVGVWARNCTEGTNFGLLRKPPSPEDLSVFIQPATPSNFTYILGPVSPTLLPGQHSVINVEGVTYGLYKKTPSGIMPVTNENLDRSPVSGTPKSSLTPSDEVKPPAIVNFTYPIYPTLPTSDVTAVGHVASQTMPWVFRLASAVWTQTFLDSTMAVLPYAASASLLTAIVGTIYYQYNRQCKGTLYIDEVDDDAAVEGEGEPLWDIESARKPVSSQLETSLTYSETDTEDFRASPVPVHSSTHLRYFSSEASDF